MEVITYFVKFQDVTKKTVAEAPTNFSELLEVFHSKFDSTDLNEADENNFYFYIDDKEFSVNHKIEDYSEIYEGGIIEGKLSSGNTLKRQLDEMKQKLDTFKDGSTTGGQIKRRKVVVVEDDGKCIVRIRGMPWQATSEDVQSFFEGVQMAEGEIESIIFLCKDSSSGRATGEAFIRFADEEAVTAALELDHKHMGHRYIDVLKSNDTERQIAVALAMEWNPEGRTETMAGPYSLTSTVIRIRGVPFGSTEKALTDFFSKADAVPLGIHLIRDNRGRASGEAFAEFLEESEGKAAMELHRQNMGRRYLEIFRSSVSELNAAFASAPGPISTASHVLRLHGLPYSATKEDVTTFFGEISLTAIHIIQDASGRPSGDAYVEIASETDVEVALKLHKQNIGSRYIEIFRSTLNELSSYLGGGGGGERGGRGGGRDRGRGGQDAYGAYGNSAYGNSAYGNSAYGNSDRRPSGNSRLPSSECLEMRGIPFSATEADIKHFFEEAYVSPIRIHRKVNGGEAFVEFGSLQEAGQALSRHKSNMGHRYIDLYSVAYSKMASTVGLPSRRASSYGGYNTGYGGGGGYGGY